MVPMYRRCNSFLLPATIYCAYLLALILSSGTSVFFIFVDPVRPLELRVEIVTHISTSSQQFL